MPLYAFRCASCGSSHDRYLKEPAPTSQCPSCGLDALRVWSSNPLVVRPTGWDRSPDDPKYWQDLTDRADRPRAQQ